MMFLAIYKTSVHGFLYFPWNEIYSGKEQRVLKNTGNRFWIAAGILIAGFALDLWSKNWAVQHLSGGTVKTLAGNTLELVLLYNRAAVFGLDPRHVFPWFPVNLFFAAFTTLASVVLIVYYLNLKKSEHLMRWGLATVLPGALGNLSDRILHPGRGVVDFIKVNLGFPPFDPWPVFNLADVWVSIGIGLIIAAIIVDERRRKKNAQIGAL
jgi:signal peptidase II